MMSRVVFIITFVATIMGLLICLFGTVWSICNGYFGVSLTSFILSIFFGVFLIDDIKQLSKPQDQ